MLLQHFLSLKVSTVEREENLPRPADHTLLNAPQDTTGLLGNKSTLLAYGQLVTHQHSQVPLCRAALQQVSTEPALVLEVIPSQVQDPPLPLLNFTRFLSAQLSSLSRSR